MLSQLFWFRGCVRALPGEVYLGPRMSHRPVLSAMPCQKLTPPQANWPHYPVPMPGLMIGKMIDLRLIIGVHTTKGLAMCRCGEVRRIQPCRQWQENISMRGDGWIMQPLDHSPLDYSLPLANGDHQRLTTGFSSELNLCILTSEDRDLRELVLIKATAYHGVMQRLMPRPSLRCS